MTRLYKDGAPAICAVIFLAIVEGINVFVNVSLRELEIFSNTILLLIAVLGFFVAGMPAKKNRNVSFWLTSTSMFLFIAIIIKKVKIRQFRRKNWIFKRMWQWLL